MADNTSSWYGGLLGSYTSGLDDPALKQQAINQGLLGLGSALLANQYYDPRNPGSGGLAKGLAEGGAALMQAPQAVRQQAYQDAVMKQKLQDFQVKQAQQKALQAWGSALPADDPRRALVSIAPDKVIENELALGLERGKYGLKQEFDPRIAAMTETAKNPALISRDLTTAEGKKKLDLAYDPETAARTFAAVNPWAIARAGGEANARNASDLAYTLPKAQASAQGDAYKLSLPVDIGGGRTMPMGQAQPFLSGLGKAFGEAQPVQMPGGAVVPAGAVGKASEESYKNAKSAQSVESILNEIEPMTRDPKTGAMVPDRSKSVLERATHSGIGSGLDWLGKQVGVSTDAGDAAAQLRVLGNALMMGMPRMEGPQSDKDVAMYREAAGNLSDPGTPVSQKRAAMEKIRALNARYAQPQAGGGWSMRPVGGQ